MTGQQVTSEFIQDREIGAKRLASMPDRITNTVNVGSRKVPSSRR